MGTFLMAIGVGLVIVTLFETDILPCGIMISEDKSIEFVTAFTMEFLHHMHNTGGDEAVPFQAYRQKAYFSRGSEGVGNDAASHAVCADGGKHSTFIICL